MNGHSRFVFRNDYDDGKCHCATMIVIWVFVVLFNMYYLWLLFVVNCQARRIRRQRITLTPNPYGDEDHLLIAEQLANRSVEEKTDYYSKLFDKHGNQLVLTEDQIVEAPENDPEMGLDTTETDSLDDQVYLSRDAIFPCSEINQSDESKSSSSSSSGHYIDGQCIICFENFRPGDAIVYNNCASYPSNDSDNSWSLGNNNSQIGCSHVYHKSCMVQYLANRKVNKEALRRSREEHEEQIDNENNNDADDNDSNSTESTTNITTTPIAANAETIITTTTPIDSSTPAEEFVPPDENSSRSSHRDWEHPSDLIPCPTCRQPFSRLLPIVSVVVEEKYIADDETLKRCKKSAPKDKSNEDPINEDPINLEAQLPTNSDGVDGTT